MPRPVKKAVAESAPAPAPAPTSTIDQLLEKVVEAVHAPATEEKKPRSVKRVKKVAPAEAPAPAPAPAPAVEEKKKRVKKVASATAPAPAPATEEKKKRERHANQKVFAKLTEEQKKHIVEHPNKADRQFMRKLRTHMMLGKSIQEAETLLKK